LDRRRVIVEIEVVDLDYLGLRVEFISDM